MLVSPLLLSRDRIDCCDQLVGVEDCLPVSREHLHVLILSSFQVIVMGSSANGHLPLPLLLLSFLLSTFLSSLHCFPISPLCSHFSCGFLVCVWFVCSMYLCANGLFSKSQPFFGELKRCSADLRVDLRVIARVSYSRCR